MAKYTFTCDHGEFSGSFKNTMEFEADFLPEVLENFETFLRGSGFFFDGKVEIYDENEETETVQVNSDIFNQMVSQHMDYLDNRQNSGVCSICGLSNDVMRGQKCYDQNCPKV